MRTKLILIGVGAAVVVTGLWFFLMWKPASNDLDTAKADKAAAEQKADALSARLAHLQQLEKNAAVLERDRQMLSTAIPVKDELDQFILQVNERASRAGVSFVSVAPSQPSIASAAPGSAVSAGVTSIGLSMQITGDYLKMLRFLEELRDGPRLLTVDNFTVAPTGAGAEMSATLSARMFMNPSAAAAAPAPIPSA